MWTFDLKEPTDRLKVTPWWQFVAQHLISIHGLTGFILQLVCYNHTRLCRDQNAFVRESEVFISRGALHWLLRGIMCLSDGAWDWQITPLRVSLRSLSGQEMISRVGAKKQTCYRVSLM